MLFGVDAMTAPLDGENRCKYGVAWVKI
jgi:hypothetical protein